MVYANHDSDPFIEAIKQPGSMSFYDEEALERVLVAGALARRWRHVSFESQVKAGRPGDQRASRLAVSATRRP